MVCSLLKIVLVTGNPVLGIGAGVEQVSHCVEVAGAASESLIGVTAVTLVTMLAWPQVTEASVYRIGVFGLGSILAGGLFVAAIRFATALSFRGWMRPEWQAKRLRSWCVRWMAALTGWELEAAA